MNRLPYWRLLCSYLAHACNGTTPELTAIDRITDGQDEIEISIDANPRIVSGSFFAEPSP